MLFLMMEELHHDFQQPDWHIWETSYLSFWNSFLIVEKFTDDCKTSFKKSLQKSWENPSGD